MSTYRNYINSRPVRAFLSFGYNENVILESVDFEQRMNKETPIDVHLFYRISKVNPVTKKVIAGNEFSCWNWDNTSDFLSSNVTEEITILSGLLSALGLDAEGFGSDVEEFVNNTLVEAGQEDIYKYLKKSDANCKTIQNKLIELFKEYLGDNFGKNSPLMKCRLISNNKGYLNPAPEANWILPMDSDEELSEITGREQEIYNKSLTSDEKKQIQPDKTGNSPKGEKDTTRKNSALDAL
jgi:hypothetical protein